MFSLVIIHFSGFASIYPSFQFFSFVRLFGPQCVREREYRDNKFKWNPVCVWANCSSVECALSLSLCPLFLSLLLSHVHALARHVYKCLCCFQRVTWLQGQLFSLDNRIVKKYYWFPFFLSCSTVPTFCTRYIVLRLPKQTHSLFLHT